MSFLTAFLSVHDYENIKVDQRLFWNFQFPECRHVESKLIIPCMVEFKLNTTGECHTFLNKIASIIFEDYRLIYHFVDQCSDDIARLQCGRIGDGDEEVCLLLMNIDWDCLVRLALAFLYTGINLSVYLVISCPSN